MFKEIISKRQSIGTMLLFILGSSLVLGTGSHAKQDVWIAMIFALLFSIPLVYIYSKLITLYPGKDIYDISQLVFGKIIGTMINTLLIWYFFHVGALVIRNFCEFIQVVSLPETPQYIIALSIGVFCICMVRAGLEVLSRWAAFICPIVFVMIFFITILSIPSFEIDNIRPILFNGFGPIFKSSISIFSLPFAETVAFTTLLSSLENKNDTFKVYIISLLIGGASLLIVSMRNILVLGVEYESSFYFPSYIAASVIISQTFYKELKLL